QSAGCRGLQAHHGAKPAGSQGTGLRTVCPYAIIVGENQNIEAGVKPGLIFYGIFYGFACD
ncbi:MAG: hypothetical protein PHS82_17165, partial [Lachnospiraceae bacterium]|nr:hypothetical protein [Lachnospiraceae bacterium]